MGPAEQFAGGEAMSSFNSETMRLFMLNHVNCYNVLVLYCLSGKTSKISNHAFKLLLAVNRKTL